MALTDAQGEKIYKLVRDQPKYHHFSSIWLASVTTRTSLH